MGSFIAAAMGCAYGGVVMWLVGFVVCGIGLYVLALVLFPIGGILRARESIATDTAVDDFFGVKRSGLSRDRRAIAATTKEVSVVGNNYRRSLSKRGFRELFIFGGVLWSVLLLIQGQAMCAAA